MISAEKTQLSTNLAYQKLNFALYSLAWLEKDKSFARVGTKSCKLFCRDVLHCKIILNLWTQLFRGVTCKFLASYLSEHGFVCNSKYIRYPDTLPVIYLL